MNISQFIFLKMGKKAVFKENLQVLKSLGNQNFQGGNNANRFQSNYYSPNNNLKKRSYEGMDIIPKFIANQNMQELNNELMDRLLKKKNIFTKMMKSYFSEGDEPFIYSIQEVEMEMNRYKDILENNKNKDYEGFMDLLSFINSNRTNTNLTAMQSISLDEYKNMNYDTKKIVLSGIYENRPLLAQKLNLQSFYKNDNTNRRANSMYNKNIGNQNRLSNQNFISKEQINLFKLMVGNQNLPDNHIFSYFDKYNPKVIIAANNYFKNIYKTDYLTLYYNYPSKGQSGTKIHKFRFTSEIKELFMRAQDDYMSIVTPRLYLENGREIKNDKRVKCIGALNISNNSKIKVLG